MARFKRRGLPLFLIEIGQEGIVPLFQRLMCLVLVAGLEERYRRLIELLLEVITVQSAQVRELNDGRRKHLSKAQRIRLAVKAAEVPRSLLCEIATVTFSPDTFMRWYKKYVGRKYDGSATRKTGGRPTISEKTRVLIIEMATSNPTWGYRRIAGELAKLEITISKSTVERVMRDAGLAPSPERIKGKPWKDFISEHFSTLYATDFFTVEVQRFFGTVRTHVLVVLELATLKVHIGGIVCDPTQEWVVQIARNLTDSEHGFLPEGSRLIHDRDPLFGKKFKETLAAADVKTVKLPPKSPNLNAFCERFNRTIKEECLNHFVICSQAHLELLVREFCAYYHAERPHQSLGNRPILKQTEKGTGVIRVRDRLGGFLKHYYRKAA